MIMHDAPALGGAAKEEGETPVWSVRLAEERPSADDQRGIATEGVILISENVSVPIFSRLSYFLLVTIAHRLPAAREFVARHKLGRIGSGVAIHEAIDIAAIPGGGLRRKHGADCREFARAGLVRPEGRGQNLGAQRGGPSAIILIVASIFFDVER